MKENLIFVNLEWVRTVLKIPSECYVYVRQEMQTTFLSIPDQYCLDGQCNETCVSSCNIILRWIVVCLRPITKADSAIWNPSLIILIAAHTCVMQKVRQPGALLHYRREPSQWWGMACNSLPSLYEQTFIWFSLPIASSLLLSIRSQYSQVTSCILGGSPIPYPHQKKQKTKMHGRRISICMAWYLQVLQKYL